MLYSGTNNVGLLGSVSEIVRVYALIIVSFIAGIHLGVYLFYNTQTPKPLLIISSVIAVLAWLSLLFSSTSNVTLVLIGALIYLLGVDFSLKRETFISPTYFVTRLIVTLISASSLLFVSIFS